MPNKAEIRIDGDNRGALNALRGVVKEVGSAESKIKSAGGGITNALSSLTSFVNPMYLLAGGITTAVGGITYMVKNAIDAADRMDELSQVTGFSTEALSTLGYAAKLDSVELESLVGYLGKFSKAVSEATDTTTEQGKAFQRLNIDVKNSTGGIRPIEMLLLDVAGKFEMMPNGIGKTTTAMQLFGKSGTQLIPFLNQGKVGISNLQEEARKLGVEISSNTAMQAAEFNDKMTALQSSFKGLALTAASALLPALNSVASSMKAYTQQGANAKIISDGIALSFKVIASAIYPVISGVSILGISLGALGAAVAKWISGGSDKEFFAVWAQGSAMVNDQLIGMQKAYESLWGSNAAAIASSNTVTTDSFDGANNEIAKLKSNAINLNQSTEEGILTRGLREDQKKLYELSKIIDQIRKGGVTPSAVITADYEKQKAQVFELNNMLSATETAKANALQLMPDPSWQIRMQEVRQTIDVYREFDAYIAESIAFQNQLELERRQIVADSFGAMSQAAQNFYNMSKNGNRVWFDTWKAFALAEATINGYNAVLGSYKAGAELGGPILGGIYAAATGIFVASQIAQIASTQPGSRGSWAGGGGGGSVSIPATAGVTNNNNQRSLQITVNVMGNFIGEDAYVRDTLIPAIEKAYGDGA